MEPTSSPVGSSATKRDAATESLDSAIVIFDQIFMEVAQIDKYNDPTMGVKTKIPKSILSSSQYCLVKQLSGFLSTTREHLRVRCESISQSDVGANVSAAATSDAFNGETHKKMNLLKEFLVAELNRSESAEQKLKAAENELVLITAERDKLQKKLASYGNAPPSSSSSTNAAAPTRGASVKSENAIIERGDHNPASHVGSFIRKPFGNTYFFGLVANYDKDHGYFQVRRPCSYELVGLLLTRFPSQVVYEDTDFEELTYAELRRVLWSGATPAAKRDACMKHARAMKHMSEALYRAMVEAYEGTVYSATSSLTRPGSENTAQGKTSSAVDVSSSSSSSSSSGSSSTSTSSSGTSDTASEAVSSVDLPSLTSRVLAVSADLAAATVSDASSSGGDNEASRDSIPGGAAPTAATRAATRSSETEVNPAVNSRVAPSAPIVAAVPKIALSLTAAVLASTTSRPKKPSPTPAKPGAATAFRNLFPTIEPSSTSHKTQASVSGRALLEGSNLTALASLSGEKHPASAVLQTTKAPLRLAAAQVQYVTVSQLCSWPSSHQMSSCRTQTKYPRHPSRRSPLLSLLARTPHITRLMQRLLKPPYLL
jgi:hypothetical protein